MKNQVSSLQDICLQHSTRRNKTKK